MRSTTGLASALTFLLMFPIAIGAQIVSDGAAELVIHVGVGLGSVLLAFAVFDFALPRWVNRFGAAASGAFGLIFLLQAVSQVVSIDALTYVAYQVLGQEIERVMPYLILVWATALLLRASHGKSRILGLATMSVVIGFEVASVVGPFVGLTVESQKILFLLPFVWLLVESVERDVDDTPRPSRQVLAESQVS